MIIITGVAGFIGSSLAKSLLLDGEKVVGIDSMSDYYSIHLKKYRLDNLKKFANFTFIHHDLMDTTDLKKILTKNDVSSLYHLAAQAGVRLKQKDYKKYISSNIFGFLNIMMVSIDYQIPNFLFASSSSVYGNKEQLFIERVTREMPQGLYGATKFTNEILAKSYVNNSNTKARALRFFTAYGPAGRPDMAYFRIFQNLILNKTFNVNGTGNQARDFTYIDDIIRLTKKLDLDLKLRGNGYFDEVNIGSGNPISINQVIELAENIVGKKLAVKHVLKSVDDILVTHADTKQLEKILKDRPKATIEEGLNKTFEWFNQKDVLLNLKLWCE